MRKYERTHPWITFSLDLSRASHRLWLLLGEAGSKANHVAGLPLLPDVRKKLSMLYLAKGIHATTAIEGNTLTEDEVLRHLEGKLDVPPSKEYLRQEIDNVLRACNSIPRRLAQEAGAQLSVQDLCGWNAAVLEGLAVGEGVVPGGIRESLSVGVQQYAGAPAEDCTYLAERLCSWLDTGFEDLERDHQTAAAILRAVLGHLYLAWIHPFGDGNGRTARLLEVFVLYSAGVPSTSAHLLSNHYNQTRSEYYRLLAASSRRDSERGVRDFIEYALQGYVDKLREQVEQVKAQQLEVHLVNHIHERFHGKTSDAMLRRRALALALVNVADSTPLAGLSRITPEIAVSYAKKTAKALHRDVNYLVELGLVSSGAQGVAIRREIMLEYIPRQMPRSARRV